MIAALPGLIASYGPVLVTLLAILAAFGLPAPASFALVIAGAYSAFGELNFLAVVLAGWAGTVTGDHLAYALAARIGEGIARTRFAKGLARAHAVMARWGTLGVFGSRWIFPTVLTPGINYVAGATRLSLARFTPAVIAGEFVYVTLFSGLGRLFSNQARAIYRIANGSLLLIFLVLVVIATAAAIVRAVRARS